MMSRHSKTTFAYLPLCLFAAGLILSGCAQKDSSVGSDLAPGLNEIYPQEMILDPTASNYYQGATTTGSSPYLYLGQTQGYQADALLKFNPYTALPDSYAVDSLVVKLYLDSVITEGSFPLDVSVLFVNRSQTWSEIGVTWDNLDSLQLGDPVASFQVPVSPADSDSVSFTLPAPDSLLRAWEWAGSGEKTLHYNNGLYLQSDKTWDHMVRFASAENVTVSRRPRLQMYVAVFDTSDTTGAEPVDTMLFIYAGGDAFIAKDFGVLDNSRLYLGNSASYRSLLLFNLQGLFPTYGVGVHRAEVVLHADTSSSFNLGQISGAHPVGMQDTSWISSPETALTEFGISPIVSVYDEENAKLTLNLTEAAYNWIRYPDSNHGFMIMSSNEYFDISRTVFYGVSAPDSLRPRLRIVYLENEP